MYIDVHSCTYVQQYESDLSFQLSLQYNFNTAVNNIRIHSDQIKVYLNKATSKQCIKLRRKQRLNYGDN